MTTAVVKQGSSPDRIVQSAPDVGKFVEITLDAGEDEEITSYPLFNFIQPCLFFVLFAILKAGMRSSREYGPLREPPVGARRRGAAPELASEPDAGTSAPSAPVITSSRKAGRYQL